MRGAIGGSGVGSLAEMKSGSLGLHTSEGLDQLHDQDEIVTGLALGIDCSLRMLLGLLNTAPSCGSSMWFWLPETVW